MVEPRFVSVGLLAIAYVFAFIRALSFTRTSRFLGPLRASMAKMFGNVLQFLALFCTVMFAFAISLTELYGYHYSKKFPVKAPSNSTEGHQCETTAFVNLGTSLSSLFWVILGNLEADCIFENQRRTFIGDIGLILLAVYHITIIFVLLNMLIAMMTQSFESTVENKDAEWKFHRTQFWLQFIRRNCTDPPPMNLLPHFINVYIVVKRIIWGRRLQSVNETAEEYCRGREEENRQISLKFLQRYKLKNIKSNENIEKHLPNTDEIMGSLMPCDAKPISF